MFYTFTIFFPMLLAFALLFGARRRRHLVCDGRANRFFVSILAVLPIFLLGFWLAGLRPETAGFDTIRYVFAYERLASPMDALQTGQNFFGNTEVLWWPLQSLLKPILGGREWLAANFLLVFAAVYACYRVACRPYGLNRCLFAFAFLTFFLVYSGNAMRQSLAIPIGALGFFYFFEGRYVRWLVLVSIAIGLHWSSLAFLSAPVFTLSIFRRDWIYPIVPFVMLTASVIMSDLVGRLIGALDFGGLSQKYDLYFSGKMESHVGQVWSTANFWLCAVISVAFLAFCRPSLYNSRALHNFVLLYISLVLFGIRIPDFSERYFPPILMVIPLLVALGIRRSRLPPMVGNAAFLGSFLLLGLLVFVTPSSQVTLGYSI